MITGCVTVCEVVLAAEWDVITRYHSVCGWGTEIEYLYRNCLSYAEGRHHVNRDRQGSTLSDRIG